MAHERAGQILLYNIVHFEDLFKGFITAFITKHKEIKEKNQFAFLEKVNFFFLDSI